MAKITKITKSTRGWVCDIAVPSKSQKTLFKAIKNQYPDIHFAFVRTSTEGQARHVMSPIVVVHHYQIRGGYESDLTGVIMIITAMETV